MSVIGSYLKDCVNFNKKHSFLTNDTDANGQGCWEMAETMLYLFANSEDEKGSFISYHFEGPTQFHQGVLYNDVYYDMIDGSVYTSSFIHNEYLEEHASNICKEKMKLISKTNYSLKTKEESETALNELKKTDYLEEL